MATIDITPHMVAGRYGAADQWVTADRYNLPAGADFQGAWIELRMWCHYTRRVERFSVLYQGPGGTMRLEQGAPQVTGPLGVLIPQVRVIANTPVAQARYIDVDEGDVLIINGQRMVILDDRPFGYPRLACEAEAGLAAAITAVRELLAKTFQRQPGTEEDNTRHNERQAALTGVLRELQALAPQLRQRHSAS